MQKIILSLSILFSLSIFSHEGGHGPALKDESHHGGKVTAIILSSEVEKGRAAKMLYKGELVFHSRKQEVKLYLFDNEMKPLNLKTFDTKVSAVQIERRKENKFELTLDKSCNFFVGNRPKNKRVPFNIDVFVKKGKKELFGAFDGLD
jgi:hypothetical protein